MTPQAFRRIGLTLPDASEGGHMGHADFRVGGKIFATVGWPDENWAMIKLGVEAQDVFTQAEPAIFHRLKGAWGRGGATGVRLALIDEITLRSALTAAWRNTAPKRLVKLFDL